MVEPEPVLKYSTGIHFWPHYCSDAFLVILLFGFIGISNCGLVYEANQPNMRSDPNMSFFDTDMIFVKKFTRPQFWNQEFYAKKRVNRNISQFATKQIKFFKMT